LTISPAFSVVFLCLTVLGTAFGQLFFRLRYVRARRSYLLLAFACFALAPAFTYLALLNLPLAMVYMSASAANVLVLVLSSKVLRETITPQHKLAAVLILLGIVVFNL
jgi:drug/metabolite transporter (DMT)-like permease